MSDFNCAVDIPKQAELKDGDLTVGREFYLRCLGGSVDGSFKIENAQFVWSEPQQKYTLKLLSAKIVSKEELQLKVTSYLAAKVAIPELVMSDGAKTVTLGPLQYEVSSVLDPQKKPEPYGPMGPFAIEWPMAYTVMMILLAVALVGWLISMIWRRRKAKALLQKLRELETVLSPEAQFFKDLRQLKRESEIFVGSNDSAVLIEARDRVERMFKVYLSRELRVLATELSAKKTMKALKGQDRWRSLVTTSDLAPQLTTLLHEFEKSKIDESKISNQDTMQLILQSQKLVEKLGNAGLPSAKELSRKQNKKSSEARL